MAPSVLTWNKKKKLRIPIEKKSDLISHNKHINTDDWCSKKPYEKRKTINFCW